MIADIYSSSSLLAFFFSLQILTSGVCVATLCHNGFIFRISKLLSDGFCPSVGVWMFLD